MVNYGGIGMIGQAILNLRPGAHFSVGETYDSLWWSNENDLPPPTEEEIQVEVERLQTEYNRQKYQRQRMPEYPPITDYVDACYWASKGDNTKLDEYYAKCETVKLQYPKPS